MFSFKLDVNRLHKTELEYEIISRGIELPTVDTDILGTANLPITLQDKTITLEVLVIPEVRQPLILGIDFWKAIDFVSNFQTGTWTFGAPGEICSISTEHLTTRSGLSSAEEQSLQLLLDAPLLNSSDGIPIAGY